MPTFRKKVTRIEDQHQIAYFAWLEIQHPDIFQITFHIPNEGKRNQIYGRKMGIKPGIPDIFLAFPTPGYGGLFIELKKPIHMGIRPLVKDNQIEMIKILNRAGYCCKLCYGWDSARKATEIYLSC